MDLDILDENYPMGKSNLPFKDFGQGGLTGVERGLTWLAQTCHFWVSTQTIQKHHAQSGGLEHATGCCIQLHSDGELLQYLVGHC
jgi:hypothetical protein